MRKRTNAIWFFVALLGGGAAIWWTKSAYADAWYAAMVAAGVVLALTIYYVLNDEDAPEEEGDNVYYLGLLFTLISLMFTLWELFGTDADTKPNTEDIRTLLENFGIALTSTVVGIAGRVLVQNWQRAGSATEPEFVDDTEVSVPPPASASSRDLESFNRHLLGRIARDLTQGANALARFHRIVRSHASDSENHLRNHSETLTRESTEFKDTLHRNAETFAQDLKSQAENTLDAVRQNFDAAAKQSLSLTQNVSTTHERIGELYERLESGLEHASDASVALGNSAHEAAKSTAVLESEIDKLRTVLSAVQASAEQITGMLDAVGELDARIRVGRDMEQTAVAVRQIGETLRTITAEGAAATEQSAKAAELFNVLTRSVQTTEGEVRRAAEALRVLANEAEARTKALRRREGSGFRFWNRSQ